MKDFKDLDSEPGQNILQQNVHLVGFINDIDEPAIEEMAEMALEDIKVRLTQGTIWDLLVNTCYSRCGHSLLKV
jgi:hypothetical protein